ncbi:MAG: hypothetical protein LBE13_19365 [Bacteroidales bacterium]|jgi:hypothetical protein|nr:hypothetical protein [Bacteroidales bacterium]
MKIQRISSFIPLFFISCAFAFVTVFNYFSLVFIGIIFLIIIILFKDKVILGKEDKLVFMLFYGIFFSSLGITIFLVFICGINYVVFYPNIFGRMINIVIYSSIYIFIVDRKNRNKISTKDVLDAYLVGCYILLFFGIWQLLSNIFKIPYPTFETRDQIHSMETANFLPFMRIRITSIALEPAYLASYLIDAIIILICSTKRYLSIGLFFIILFFSLSLSGYINIFLIIMIMFGFSRNNSRNMYLNIFIFLLLLFLFFLLKDIFFTVIKRLNPEALVESGRFQDTELPIKYMFTDASLFNIIFGFGPKGFGYVRRFLSYTRGWARNTEISTTSHVIFVDFLVEYGVLGVILILLLFYYLYQYAKITYRFTANRLSQLLCINLLISALYTSDYASPRFSIMLIIILFLYKDAKTDENIIY